MHGEGDDAADIERRVRRQHSEGNETRGRAYWYGLGARDFQRMAGVVFPLAVFLWFINELDGRRSAKQVGGVGFLRLQRPSAAGLTHEMNPSACAVGGDDALPAWSREHA